MKKLPEINQIIYQGLAKIMIQSRDCDFSARIVDHARKLNKAGFVSDDQLKTLGMFEENLKHLTQIIDK